MMQRPNVLLENVLNQIENRIKEDVNSDFLAENIGISSVHLQRLFKFAFKKSLGSYIRSRKLAASLESLFNTNSSILNIAFESGFGYEQSYIKAFKQEFGITPGNARRKNQMVKIAYPLNLFGAKLLDNGIIFEPEILMIPQFYVIGRKHQIPYSNSINMAPKAGKHFWANDRMKIANPVKENVYIGLTRTAGIDADYTWYLPSIQVKTLKNIPEGLEGFTFPSTLCAKFCYIGQHHYFDINRNKAKNMYSAIENFFDCEYGREFSRISDMYFERIDTETYDGNYCQMEWFAPIKIKKTEKS
jgi:AraC family transcriptional regulator